ncbi:hypothetical protein [Streptomyces sp. WMMB303]|uniref:hypothetical protein n=1 Tax=Streptomyces sp. WMMB303 TaxID=3034154 RepID=UPI0023ECA499|nr:hypothetical protein [Streptomyces sp. WMMB303]MDF4254669.1 hypothetical protein [Streptomyces sp. WMMB303]MDF4254706.1 hypothetical protein [Streptomyces sp. WMMB303]
MTETASVVWDEELGLCDRSDLSDVLIEREGDRGTPDCVLGTEEVWDFDAVDVGWREVLRERLAPHGIRYDVTAHEVGLPSGMSHEAARRLVGEAQTGFAAWIDQVVGDVRAGKPDPRYWDVRADTDPGGRWIKMAAD